MATCVVRITGLIKDPRSAVSLGDCALVPRKTVDIYEVLNYFRSLTLRAWPHSSFLSLDEKQTELEQPVPSLGTW